MISPSEVIYVCANCGKTLADESEIETHRPTCFNRKPMRRCFAVPDSGLCQRQRIPSTELDDLDELGPLLHPDRATRRESY
jgi:hypothetical protein